MNNPINYNSEEEELIEERRKVFGEDEVYHEPAKSQVFCGVEQEQTKLKKK